MAKKRTLAQEAEKVSKALQRLVRLKAADGNGYASCVTCGYTAHWKDMDGGHFISRGKTATKLIEENVNTQCKGCNLRMGRGDSTVFLNYIDYMKDMYGDDYIEELRRKSREVKKWDRQELEELHEEIKEQTRYHMERVGY